MLEKFIDFILTILAGWSFIMLFWLLLAYPLMWLYNITIPEIYGLSEITFWQMYKLSLLVGFLCKGN